ncbi:MAG: hypothetical protein M3159_05265 [Actinomycetota bacterium]|nr:hypothetical protein [Actinomycetota bacterium]
MRRSRKTSTAHVIRNAGGRAKGASVSGHIYDVKTGKLDTVIGASD